MSNDKEELFLWTDPDGSVSVFIPSGGMTDQSVRDNIIPSDAVNIRKTKRSNFPKDRLFRAAWDDSNPEEHVGLNIGKSKLIAHEIRREKREEAFDNNLVIIDKVSKGIPLKDGEDGGNALTENATYKANVDDVVQVDIDSSDTEEDLRSALDKL